MLILCAPENSLIRLSEYHISVCPGVHLCLWPDWQRQGELSPADGKTLNMGLRCVLASCNGSWLQVFTCLGVLQTHTMLGTPDQAGLIPRAVEQLFTAARELVVSQGWTFEMKVRLFLQMLHLQMGRLVSHGGCT